MGIYCNKFLNIKIKGISGQKVGFCPSVIVFTFPHMRSIDYLQIPDLMWTGSDSGTGRGKFASRIITQLVFAVAVGHVVDDFAVVYGHGGARSKNGPICKESTF